MKRIAILTFFLIFYLSNIALARDSFRWGIGLVGVGDTAGEVLMTCGQPSIREATGSQTKGSYRGSTQPRGRGQYTTRGTYSETSESVETWYYNCGRGRFIQILTFKGGVLVDIEDGDRGSGEPDWERTR